MPRFFSAFQPDIQFPRQNEAGDFGDLESIASEITQLMTSYGGTSFRSGLYRLHTPRSMHKWTAIVTEAFPEYRHRLHCFGYDWLGRQFALDRHEIVNGQAHILFLDVSFGEAFHIPSSLIDFHEGDLVDHADAALSDHFHAEWLNSGGGIPSPDQCVGYRIFPLLGGKDVISNLELSDMEVYWALASQIRLARVATPSVR